MNHEYVSKSNLIDQYVLGKLAADEVEAFEDHFVDCPECVEQLKISRSFIHDLKGLAVQETLFSGSSSTPRTQRWSLPQLVPLRLWPAIACCCIVAVSVLAFVAVRRANRLEAQLHQAKEDASAISQKYQQEVDAAAEAEKRHQETKQDLTQRLDELEKKLKTEETAGNRDQFAGHGSPAVNFPIFSLISAARTQGQNRVEVSLPAASSRFALSIPVEERKDFKAYRVTILDHRGAEIFNQSGFKPDDYHALSLSLNSNFLAPGNYDLQVEGLNESNQWSTVGNYPFRVSRRR